MRVYPGRVAGAGDTFVTVECRGDDAVTNLMAAALERFGLDPTTAANDYRCSEILLDRGGWLKNFLDSRYGLLTAVLYGFMMLFTYF